MFSTSSCASRTGGNIDRQKHMQWQWLQQVRSSSGETARAMRVADGTSAGELPLFHPHHLPASVCALKKLEVHVKAEL